ncbi:MAG: MotA/TolQ/ExbB proton channel family protein [Deltaproteobacteria bacterium]|nr:MotA/TolQ/ExbB proton channel family protein [Deltaproteobacteria bacterium]
MVVEQLLKVAQIGSTWVLFLLLGLSVVSIGVMVERALYFRGLRDPGRGVRAPVAAALGRGDLVAAERILGASRTVEARVVRQALAWRDGGPGAVADAIESELGTARVELERGLNFLGTLGNNAPFVGLFGTVLGVIEAFHQLAGGANKAAMGNVMSGIAEALIATGVGLFVALPAVVAYNVFQKRITDVEGATGALGKLVTAYLQTPAAALDRRDLAEARERVVHLEAEAPADDHHGGHDTASSRGFAVVVGGD